MKKFSKQHFFFKRNSGDFPTLIIWNKMKDNIVSLYQFQGIILKAQKELPTLIITLKA